jgi:hypothetical protein
MPVMGRFRLRREGRRAFLQSRFAVKGPVCSFAEILNLSVFARHYVCEKRPIRRRFIGPLLKVLNSRFSTGTRKQALHLRPLPDVPLTTSAGGVSP